MLNIWRNIKSAPKDGTSILVFCPEDGTDDIICCASWRGVKDAFPNCPIITTWYIDYSDGDELGGALDVKPTHWMPLPKPPKKK